MFLSSELIYMDSGIWLDKLVFTQSDEIFEKIMGFRRYVGLRLIESSVDISDFDISMLKSYRWELSVLQTDTSHVNDHWTIYGTGSYLIIRQVFRRPEQYFPNRNSPPEARVLHVPWLTDITLCLITKIKMFSFNFKICICYLKRRTFLSADIKLSIWRGVCLKSSSYK